MDPSTQTHKRRVVLIDPRFQFRLVAAFLLVQVVLTGLFSLGLYLFLSSELQANLLSAHATLRNLSGMLLPVVGFLALFNLLTSTVLVTIFVVLLSHRIAGPLYRFRAVLEDFASRRIPPHTAIRPEDQFQEVAESLTRAAGVLEADFGELRIAVDRLEKAQESEDSQALRQGLVALRGLAGRWTL